MCMLLGLASRLEGELRLVLLFWLIDTYGLMSWDTDISFMTFHF